MNAKIGKFFDSVGNFFSGGDQIPWTDSDVVAGCEREVALAEKNSSSDGVKNESIMRLTWALVHSKRPHDVHRGIAMLETSLTNKDGGTGFPLQVRERLYLLAVGYYRNGDYSRSRNLVDHCLERAPEWRQALALKNTVENKIRKDGIIGIGIAATAVGLIAGVIAAIVLRKK